MKIITLLLFLLLPGCASILSDDQYIIEVKSHPLGANFSVTDTRGNLIHQGVTPETISLYSGAGYFDHAQYKVMFEKEGFHKEIRELKSEIDEMYFANATNILGFFAVDPAGAMYELPDSVHAFLKEKPAPPVAQYVPYYRFNQPTIYRRPVVKVLPIPAPIPLPLSAVPAVIEQIVTPISERVTTHTTEQVDTIQHSETHFEPKPCTKETQPCAE